MIETYKTPTRPRYLVRQGFTIVELLIVIVVIAILAVITIVAYNGITTNATDSALKADLNIVSKKANLIRVETGSYPDLKPSGLPDSTQYIGGGASFCATASSKGRSFFIKQNGNIERGSCPEHDQSAGEPIIDGSRMQTVTLNNCPENRTMAVDARDNKTYWVKKMPDNRCWMLTNLAYAGGGNNEYSDVKTLTSGAGDTSGTVTVPKYYTPTSANPTTSPTLPSTSQDGGVSGRQYGLSYNWCAAMGAQVTTSACKNAAESDFSPAVSACPSGWRLPTGGADGELDLLLASIGANNSTAGVNNLQQIWMAQRGGYYFTGGYDWEGYPINGSYGYEGSYGNYWTSTQTNATSARSLYYSNFDATVKLNISNGSKATGYSVRCISV